MKQWVHKEVSAGGQIKELPCLAEELGGQRLALLTQLLGADEAERAAEEAGLYQLGDSLVQRLQLQGVKLGPEGELACLSPARWSAAAVAEEIPVETTGVLLSDEEARELGAFLQKTGSPVPSSARALAEVARHYFFERRLRLSVRA